MKRKLRTLLFCVLALTACSSARGVLTGEPAFVAPEKVRLRSSTAEAARTVGEVKSGDEVQIIERKNEGNMAWAHVNAPNGVSGWLEARFLVKREITEAAQKIAAEIQDIPTQATGKSKATLKLRLTPDRNTEDNVAFLLPSGTSLEIVARERKPRPKKLDPKPAATGAGAIVSTGPNFDDWYQVRLKNLTIVPAGWIYGGSVELEVPGDISFFSSTDRRITGWQTLGTTQDEQNQTKEHYLVVEKRLFGAEEQLDFDRIKVLAFDPKRREYYTPLREDVRGRFPIHVKRSGNHGTFSLQAFDKNAQPVQLDYNYEFNENGRPKIVRVTPKESGKKR